MTSFHELYQDTILDHSQSPRKSEPLKVVTSSVVSKNPLCGDVVNIEVQINEGMISDVSCKTSGCAISTAAGSIMATEIVGKSVAEAIAVTELFIEALKERKELEDISIDLCTLSKVSKYPTRIKCAVLPWAALKDVLAGGLS